MNKKLIVILIVALISIFLTTPLFSQSIKGLSLGGATGLITTPSGMVAWEGSTDLGLDFGYHFSTNRGFGENESIVNVVLTMFSVFETGITMDLQQGENETDVLVFGKYQMYNSGDSGMAIGGNFQVIDLGPAASSQYGQIYLASTYAGNFMDVPAVTTLVFGKTFNINEAWDNSVDFSMGFDLSLFPGVFHGYLHWISEFSNYSYSMDSIITNASSRGAFNTGIRVELLPNSRYKLVLDATLMDVFDTGINSFTLGGSFGLPIR